MTTRPEHDPNDPHAPSIHTYITRFPTKHMRKWVREAGRGRHRDVSRTDSRNAATQHMVGWSVDRLIDGLVDWWSDWWIGWFIDRLIDDWLIRVFAENLVGLSFLQSISYILSIPTHEKTFAVGRKKWLKYHFEPDFFLGWVGLGLGEFVRFIIIFHFYASQPNRRIW